MKGTDPTFTAIINTSMVSYQKGPTRHAYAWQIGPFWQDTLDCHVHTRTQVEANYLQQGENDTLF